MRKEIALLQDLIDVLDDTTAFYAGAVPRWRAFASGNCSRGDKDGAKNGPERIARHAGVDCGRKTDQ
jgi:hypothetical protein